MPPRADTTRETQADTAPSNAIPREEILAVAARAFRENRDAYYGLGYQYVVLRGDRLVGVGLTPQDAWAQAEVRGIPQHEAFCASVRGGATVLPF